MSFTNAQLEAFGMPAAVSYVPSLQDIRKVIKSTFLLAVDSGISADELSKSLWARIKNAYLYVGIGNAERSYVRAMQKVFEKVSRGFPQLPVSALHVISLVL